MDPAQRPRRFIVLPPLAGEGGSARSLPHALALRAPPATASTAPTTARARTAPPLEIVNTSPADGALLVEGEHATLAQVRARAPAGATVLAEQWYRLERPARPWMASTPALVAPLGAAPSATWTVTVAVQGPEGRKPLADALVTVMIDEASGVGLEAGTDRHGRAAFALGTRLRRVDAVYVDPLHGGWPVALQDVAVSADGLAVVVPAIARERPDVRGLVYGKPAAPRRRGREGPVQAAGLGLRVGVVDTGVGPHQALEVEGGRNLTTEFERWVRDENGHGTHVAGLIAAQAPGWSRGEASAVALRSYRIFERDDPYASTFAIQAAIKQAALEGCDLVNLSVGDSMADAGVRQALEFAWARGCVCVAATGNDGKSRVDYPARYARALAVSAMGLEGSWPEQAAFDWTLSTHRGKDIAGFPSFLASFSNRGTKVGLTAPGVAVVSTIFGGRWGVMCGTSMAAPIATGVIARRLAKSPVAAMPRDAARAAAIVRLALEHAEDLGLAAAMQGAGLAR